MRSTASDRLTGWFSRSRWQRRSSRSAPHDTLEGRRSFEKGAVVRALVFLNVYAAFAAVVNVLFGTNFLYLRHKPKQPSPLDWMGPWPWYLVAAEIVAAVLFFIADAPFRWKRREE